jgi:hypothetical protein
MSNSSNILQVVDAEDKVISAYFRRIGKKGGAASKGTDKAKERASKAGKASAAFGRSKRQAAAVDTE